MVGFRRQRHPPCPAAIKKMNAHPHPHAYIGTPDLKWQMQH